MTTFTLFIWDKRYNIPTVALIDAEDRTAVVAAARKRLEETLHYIAIEIFEDENMLVWLDREDIIWLNGHAEAG